MPFHAIVHAPTLRTGARVNIAEADQVETRAPRRIDTGADVRLRFGTCCPDLARGTIIDHLAEPESLVLAIGEEQWMLLKGHGGVTTPGLLSEDWFVTAPASCKA